ncbi:PAS domain-containing protein [bacterium]|nr:PAS domain-containing protein [bacterium]
MDVVQNILASDLPLLFDFEPGTGRLQRLRTPQAAPDRLEDLLSLLHPDDRAHLVAAMDQALAQGLDHFRRAARLVSPAGPLLSVTIHGAAVAGAVPPRYLVTLIDETAHFETLERFHLATAASNEVIFLLDFEAQNHWWSEAFTRIFGHQPLNAPDAVARWFDLVHPADQARVGASHRAARGGTADTWTAEYRLRKADGTFAQVIDRARFIRRPDGTIARSVSTLTDVTERRALEDLFHETALAAQDVIYSHDLGAGSLWLNEAFQARFGHDPRPFAQDPHRWVDLLAPPDRDAFVAQCEAAVRGTARRIELRYRLRRADGQYRAVIDLVQIVRDETGRALRLVGTIVDVTDRRAEEERLRAVVEAAADAVFEYDVIAGTVTCLEGVERSFGHACSGPRPNRDLWAKFLHPDDCDRVAAAFARFVAGTDRHARLDYRFARADGRWAWVSERLIALRNERGEAWCVIGGLEDVTQAHDTEERLRQSEKLEAIGKLTGGVAHDFNNLLTVIVASAALLEGDPALAPDQRALAQSVTLAARRGAELTSGLLSFARKQPLAPRPLAMASVFAEIRSMLDRTLPAYVALTTHVAPDLWLAEADPTQLNTALLNLCVNAADAMPGGGRITLQARNWVIDAAQASADPEVRAGDYLRIDITDDGTGMSAEVRARAFDPFFTTKSWGRGSGLGLSMVWGFSRQSGGHATIQSAAGLGTTVTLFLPRSRRAALSSAPTARAEPAYGHGEHILVVEDDPMLRRFVVTLIQRLRYRVSQAETGDQALQILRTTPDIALLFSDVVMPGNMSGAELAERALREFPDLRLLFTSGYSETAVALNGQPGARLGAEVQFLAKPYQMRELGDKLREVLTANQIRAKQSRG